MNFKKKWIYLTMMLVTFNAFAFEHVWFNRESANKGPRPLIVWLHGCTESPGEFLELTQIWKIAEKMNAVIYAPQQPATRNVLKCWNWFLPDTQKRGGQLKSMIREIDQMIESNEVDRKQIYLGGFSAGGVMATHFAACYPEYFKGIIIHSGAPLKYLSPLNLVTDRLAKDAFQCNQGQIQQSKIKNILIFQGRQDSIVSYKISQKIVDQLFGMFDLLDNQKLDQSNLIEKKSWIKYHSQNDFIPQYETSSEHTEYQLSNGPKIEIIIIPEMGHAWSGGTYGLKFSSPDTLNATEYSFKQFLNQARSNDEK